jgi:hypothetical protein
MPQRWWVDDCHGSDLDQQFAGEGFKAGEVAANRGYIESARAIFLLVLWARLC